MHGCRNGPTLSVGQPCRCRCYREESQSSNNLDVKNMTLTLKTMLLCEQCPNCLCCKYRLFTRQRNWQITWLMKDTSSFCPNLHRKTCNSKFSQMPKSSSKGSSNSSLLSPHNPYPHSKPLLPKPSAREGKSVPLLLVQVNHCSDGTLARNRRPALVQVMFHLNRQPLLPILWPLPSL